MAILTENDEGTWFTSSLTGDALVAAIAYLQLAMEGPSGANRPLEVTSFTETLPVNVQLQTVRLSYLPVLSSPAPVFQIRTGNYLNRLYNPVSLSNWQTLQSGQYVFDQLTGQISLNFSLPSFGRAASPATELKATYSSGYNFSSKTDKDVLALKAIAGKILEYQQSTAAQGIKEIDVDGEVKVAYATPSQGLNAIAGSIPEGFLLQLRKYRPRGT